MVLLHPVYQPPVTALQNYLLLDHAHKNLRAAYPRLGGPWTIELPINDPGALTAWYNPSTLLSEASNSEFKVSIDPTTGTVISGASNTFAIWIHDLHSQLLMGSMGALLVAVAGMTMIFVLIAGLRLSLPRQADKSPRLSTSAYPLSALCKQAHTIIGVTAFPILAVIAVTGIVLAFPADRTWPENASPGPHQSAPSIARSSSEPSFHPIGLAEATLVAHGVFPHAQLRSITTPAGETGTYKIELCQRDEDDCGHPGTAVWIDQFSGQIREVQNAKHLPFRQRFLERMLYYHSGHALGQTGIALWFVTGWLPLILFGTGLYRYAQCRGWTPELTIDLVQVATQARNGLLLVKAQLTYLISIFRSLLMRLSNWLTQTVLKRGG
jgi:uncharacterized iron-regulated membrane protein